MFSRRLVRATPGGRASPLLSLSPPAPAASAFPQAAVVVVAARPLRLLPPVHPQPGPLRLALRQRRVQAVVVAAAAVRRRQVEAVGLGAARCESTPRASRPA